MKSITYDETKYVLVPIEPTLEMRLAASDYMIDNQDADFYAADVYKVMLNTAPAAERPDLDVAKAIHYPDCWDAACYPTLEDALTEIGGFRCTNDDCAERPDHRAVMEQALEALEFAEYHLTPNVNIAAKLQKPITDLRSALSYHGGVKEWKPDPNWMTALEKLIPTTNTQSTPAAERPDYRKVMEHALEALEVYWGKAEHRRTKEDEDKASEAMDGLRAALENIHAS